MDLVVAGGRARLARRPGTETPEGIAARAGGAGLVSWLDVKLGVRMLARHPGLTLVSVFALGVGIPVGLAPDHVVDGIMAPLPVPDGREVRALRLWSPAEGRATTTTTLDLEAWRGALASFDGLAAFRETAHNVDAGEGGGAAVRGAEVTASTFDVLRVRPALGRALQPADEAPGAADVVVLGHDLWQARYAGDPAIVGRTVRLGGTPHTVVGVMPRGFLFPRHQSLWTPLRAPAGVGAASAIPVQIFGRLRPGATDEEASTELAVVAGRSAPRERDPRARAQVGPFALTALPGAPGGLRGTSEVLVFRGLALLVLLVACGNVGMLVFARTATRAGELGVRTALGASRARIVTQVFVECLVVAVVASGVGLLLLQAVASGLGRVVPGGWITALPWWIDWDVGPRTALRALGLAGASAVVAGVVPAVRFTGRSVQATIQRARSRRSGRRFGGLTGALIVADVAVAVAAVGFALRAGDQLRKGGFAQEGVGIPAGEYLAATVRLPSPRAGDGDATATASANASVRDGSSGPGAASTGPVAERTRRGAVQEELVRRLRAEPGVRGVVVADALPRMDHRTHQVQAEGVEPPDGRRGVSARVARVAVDFFPSLHQPVLAGRDFGPGDLEEARSTVIVNTTFVERVLSGQNALGRRIRFIPWGDGEPGEWKEIVGVVGHLGMRLVSGEDQGVYEPFAPGDLETVTLGLHVGLDPAAFAPRLRTLAGEVDPGAIVASVRPLDGVYEGDWYVMLAASLGAGLLVGVLLAVAASGIYALLSFSVAERRTEIGIRGALGARRVDLVLSVARRALLQVAVGVVLGMPLAAVFLLDDDGPAYAGVAGTLALGAAILLLVGAVACTGPTLRALRVRPGRVLNGDG